MKLTQDEYRGYIVKYLVLEGLKCYKIPLPSIISKNLGNITQMSITEKDSMSIISFQISLGGELHFGVRTAGNP